MKTRIYTLPILTVALILISCEHRVVVPKDLQGYWEIKEVQGIEGNDRDYKASVVLDWYEFTTDSSGIRRKVSPRLDGSFTGSRDTENFVLRETDSAWLLVFSTELMTHTEEIMTLEKDRFTLKNAEGVLYLYQRFEPLEITP